MNSHVGHELPSREGPVDVHIVYMTVEPVRDVRNHFSDVVGRVEHGREGVTVTRNGRPVAVILSPEDLAELEETLTALGDPRAEPPRRITGRHSRG